MALDRGGIVRVEFLGGSDRVEPVGLDQLESLVSYFRGSDPQQWVRAVPTFARVLYPHLYPGIDLAVDGAGGRLEWNVELAPGVDPTLMKFAVTGAERVAIDAAGDMVATAAGVEVRYLRPRAFQDSPVGRTAVEARYVRHADGTFAFVLGAYDRSLPLIIDPVLECAGFLGGSDDDWANDIAVDASGNVIVVGVTYSTNFPIQSQLAGAVGEEADAFVAKFTPDGVPAFITYLGGAHDDEAWGVGTDPAGNIYVGGRTLSEDFPTRNPFQAANAFPWDAFIAKLDPSGSQLVYSTYLGGSRWDNVQGIAVDPAGSAYLVGATDSPDFPTRNPLQSAIASILRQDCFVAKLAPDGRSLAYSTFLGGSDEDSGSRIRVDGAGNAYVVGTTWSTDFPTAAPFEGTNAGGSDAFVAKLNPSGSTLVFSTYLGGSNDEEGWDIAVDGSSSVYVVGDTASTDLPTKSASQGTNAGDWDAFVAKLSPTGTSLVFATYLGGEGADTAYGIAVAGDSAYVAGSTSSRSFPLAAAIQSSYRGDGADLFLTTYSAAGRLITSTYLGGVNTEEAYAVATDTVGHAYVAGFTSSTDFPARNSVYPSFRGLADAFWLRTDGAADTCALTCDANVGIAASVGAPATFSATATATGCTGATSFEWTFGDGSAVSASQSLTHAYSAAGLYEWRLVARAGALACTHTGSIAIATAVSVPAGKFVGTTSQGLPIEIDFGAGGQTAGWAFDSACATDSGRRLWATSCTATGNVFSCGSALPCVSSSQLVGAFTSSDNASGSLFACPGPLTHEGCCMLDLTWTARREGAAQCAVSCSATVPQAAHVRDAVAFAGTATATDCAGAVAFDWDFGDGTAHSTTQSPSHAYVSPGAYQWTLTASVDGQSCVKTGAVAVAARMRRRLKPAPQ